MELVSVALATYNGEKYIKEQLDSILNQTYQNFEIVIHDDCSTDNTIKIIEEYAKRDNRIVYKQNSENLGFAKNFESIINECKGTYIAFSDQDDIWTPNHIQILYHNSGEKNVSCGNALIVDSNGFSLGYTMKDVTNMASTISSESIKYKLFYDNFVQGAAMLISKTFCEKYLPVPEIVKYHDYWLALIASLDGGISYSEDVILYYRQHGKNITSNGSHSFFRDIYNSLNGFNRKHSQHQVEILKQLQKNFSENEEIVDAINFFEHHALGKKDDSIKLYYSLHEKEMFPLDKYRKLKKFFYVDVNI